MLAAGGTGGHLFPAMALAQELQRRGIAVELVTDMRAEKYGADFPARRVHRVPSATLVGRSLGAITRTAVNTTIADLLSSPFRISPPGVTSLQRDFRPPTVYNWSFGIQQNVGHGVVLDVAYVGNVGGCRQAPRRSARDDGHHAPDGRRIE